MNIKSLSKNKQLKRLHKRKPLSQLRYKRNENANRYFYCCHIISKTPQLLSKLDDSTLLHGWQVLSSGVWLLSDSRTENPHADGQTDVQEKYNGNLQFLWRQLFRYRHTSLYKTKHRVNAGERKRKIERNIAKNSKGLQRAFLVTQKAINECHSSVT